MTECSALAGLFSTVQGIIISGAPGGETLPGARGGTMGKEGGVRIRPKKMS